MPAEPGFAEDFATPPNPSAPRATASWIVPAVGLLAVTVLALTSVALMRRYMASRPLDLTVANASMADHIEAVLGMTPLPPGSVKRYEPVSRSDEAARWSIHTFDVGVPPNVPAGDIVAALKQGMALKNVSLAEPERSPGQWRELRFSMLHREFAAVRVVGGAERHDLTAACATLAQEVESEIRAIPGVLDVAVRTEQDREEGPARWRAYTLRALLDSTAMPDELRDRLSRTLAPLEGENPAVSLTPGIDRLEVFWRNRLVVRVELMRFSILYDMPTRDVLADPTLLHERSPILFRSLFGFEPEPSATLPRANPSQLESHSLAPTPEVKPKPEPMVNAGTDASEPRAAIIVDDGGYGGLASDAILRMDPRLTLAILPGTPFARETAQKAASRGFEVLVHMPLESGNTHEPYPGELTTAMAADELETRVAAALDEVPGATGMNNHTGSRFTADKESMTRFLSVLQQRGLFFVDSRTTAATVAEPVARQLGVPIASRSVFLDNEPDSEHIRAQAKLLADTAAANGAAIGIGHFRSTTADMLPEIIRILNDRGVTLVHVSELVQ